MSKLTTIVALSTPPIKSAIHLIRLSGPDTFAIINKITDKEIKKEGFKLQYVNIVNNQEIVDDVLISKFVSPKSYTGEDMVEINCHGSVFIAQKIIDLLTSHGAVLADRGEFTKRAYFNNKLNLLQAEAINNIINASSEISLSIARNPIDKKLHQQLINVQKTLFKIIGQIEVNIDYPEFDDVPDINNNQIENKLNEINLFLNKLANNSTRVLPIMKGIKVAIVGKPNAGKSSLLNALLNQDKAIVSNVSGTTRDTIEHSVIIDGITLNFIDTAGIRKTKNKIEKIGVGKSKQAINEADLVLFIIDNSKKVTTEDLKIFNLIKNKKHLIVLNKSDLASKQNQFKGINVSAKQKDVKALIKAIKKEVLDFDLKDSLILPSENAISKIKSCINVLNKIGDEFKKQTPLDLLVEDLHEILNHINDLLGLNGSYSFIDELFKNFCVGK
ncbi:MAG: tRNA uridine-5-carboxymethylaminomethyl(34) synthesis GTPase MnmE [Mycoplasma sp.]